jgi:hypothetical protein
MVILIVILIIVIRVIGNFNFINPSFIKDSFILIIIQVHQVLTYNSIIVIVMDYSSFVVILKMLNDSIIVIVIIGGVIIKVSIIVKLIIKEHYQIMVTFSKEN